MKLPPLTRAHIEQRYKRFLADVVLQDGTRAVAHCANTGSMTGCWAPGAEVELSRSGNPARKLPWTLERVRMNGHWVGVNTARVNAIVAEGITLGSISPLAGYAELVREPRWPAVGSAHSRFDMMLREAGRPDVYVEVKNTTLLCGDEVRFPDAVTERGRKHLELLADAVRAGHRGVIVFAVNRGDGRHFAPTADIDPAYAESLERVARAGVEVLVVRLRHTVDGIETGGTACWQE